VPPIDLSPHGPQPCLILGLRFDLGTSPREACGKNSTPYQKFPSHRLVGVAHSLTPAREGQVQGRCVKRDANLDFHKRFFHNVAVQSENKHLNSPSVCHIL
jgi:hypothetical protein